MKYKTLTRLAVRFLGVFFLAEFVISFPALVLLVSGMVMESNPSLSAFTIRSAVQACLQSAAKLGVGLYLVRGGDRVVNYLIPSNRPYCHECGYELTHAASKHCPECGTEHNRPTPPA